MTRRALTRALRGKLSRCPRCGRRDGVRIVYGMPDPTLIEAAQRGKVALGGCVIRPTARPTRHCLSCGHNWAGGLLARTQHHPGC